MIAARVCGPFADAPCLLSLLLRTVACNLDDGLASQILRRHVDANVHPRAHADRFTSSSTRAGSTRAPLFALATTTTPPRRPSSSPAQSPATARSSFKLAFAPAMSISGSRVRRVPRLSFSSCHPPPDTNTRRRHAHRLDRARRRRLRTQLPGPRGLRRGMAVHPRSTAHPPDRIRCVSSPLFPPVLMSAHPPLTLVLVCSRPQAPPPSSAAQAAAVPAAPAAGQAAAAQDLTHPWHRRTSSKTVSRSPRSVLSAI